MLDENRKEIKPCFCYRDSRTTAVVDEVESLVSSTELYAKTGIQKQNFNTIYQLYADKKSGRLLNAKYFLMMPEYLSFKLTGVCKNEYTNATTTGLVNANAKTWDSEIISVLGLPKELFAALNTPSSIVGDLSADIQKAVGFNCAVLFAPSHDTASAVCACPMADNDLYISSGTWSPDELMADIDKVISLVPGKMKLNLHACYAIFDEGEFADRNDLEPKHFAKWVEFAKKRNMGIDFNPTFFSHPMVKDNLTLSSPDESVRSFWVEHGKRCLKIAEYFVNETGEPCVMNIWIPDGYKDIPADRLAPRERFKNLLMKFSQYRMKKARFL